MSTHNGQKFSTKDQDNDAWSDNCAVRYKGAWWFHHCHVANLNGLYGSTALAEGINWNTWKGFQLSMAYTAIMVKKGE